jgi:hypothetical protein
MLPAIMLKHSQSKNGRALMPHETPFILPKKEVRARSYLIWEREGQRHGHADEYWRQAEKEIVGECRAALEGATTRFVLPRLVISDRPVRHVSGQV